MHYSMPDAGTLGGYSDAEAGRQAGRQAGMHACMHACMHIDLALEGQMLCTLDRVL
jgi:hypothetical protein